MRTKVRVTLSEIGGADELAVYDSINDSQIVDPNNRDYSNNWVDFEIIVDQIILPDFMYRLRTLLSRPSGGTGAFSVGIRDLKYIYETN